MIKPFRHRFQSCARGAAAAGVTLSLLFQPLACHLYDAGDHALAEAAQKSFRNAKPGASLEAEKELSAKMLEAEISTVRKNVEAARDDALAHVIDGTWNGFLDAIDRRLETLTGGGPISDKLLAAWAKLGEEEKNLKAAEERYNLGAPVMLGPGQTAPRVACPMTSRTAAPAEVAILFAGFQRSCERYLDARRTFDDAFGAAGGEIGQAVKRLESEKKVMSERKKESSELVADYNKAASEYRAAAKNAPEREELEKLKKTKGEKVKKALAGLSKAAEKGSAFAELAQLEARYDAIVASMDRVVKAEPATDSALEILASAALVDSRLTAEQRLPLLLIEAERLRAAMRAAKSEIDQAEREVALLELELRASIVEVKELIAARTAVAGTEMTPALAPPPQKAAPKVGDTKADKKGTAAGPRLESKPKDKNKPAASSPPATPSRGTEDTQAAAAPACVAGSMSVFENFEKSSGACRTKIAAALLHYVTAWNLGQLPVHAARWSRFSSIHDRAIDLSLAAMKEWEIMLGIPIQEVVRYHAAGVKPEVIAQIVVQAAGFGAIFAGVLAK